MDRDQLKRWLDEGHSLPQIAALVGRDPSTVGYWVQKHGLVANGNAKFSPRGGLTRNQLETLVEDGATLGEIAEVLAEVCRLSATGFQSTASRPTAIAATGASFDGPTRLA
jgi:hypothetical protein